MSDVAPKCPPCKTGAPAWMATFSDLVTLLLTFFVLLLSFAKTETAKYESALGSVRNAFGGNVLKAGDVLRPGKSPDDSPTMIDSDQPPRPFPIEFLTSEGLLDKHEVNRDSDEQLNQMKKLLADYDLSQDVDVFEMPSAIHVRMKSNIEFKRGSTAIEKVQIQVLDKIIKLMRENNWNVMIEGFAETGESSISNRNIEAFELSSLRALAVSKLFMERGVDPERMTTLFYGDSRTQPKDEENKKISDRRVEILLKKVDLRVEGKKVRAY